MITPISDSVIATLSTWPSSAAHKYTCHHSKHEVQVFSLAHNVWTEGPLLNYEDVEAELTEGGRCTDGHRHRDNFRRVSPPKDIPNLALLCIPPSHRHRSCWV